MLNVAVHNLVQVDILKPNRYLCEDLHCMLLGKGSQIKGIHVIIQVSTLCIFRDDIDEVFDLEMVHNSEHVFAVFAAVLGVDLRDVVLSFSLIIFFARNSFYGDVEPNDVMSS